MKDEKKETVKEESREHKPDFLKKAARLAEKRSGGKRSSGRR